MSVITPTMGRMSLAASVTSVLPELQQGDELIIVGDGRQVYARGVARLAASMTEGQVVYTEVSHPSSVYGNAQRDEGLRLASGTHVAFVDDDDQWCEGAGDLIRDATWLHPHSVHVFKARWGSGHHWQGILWRERSFTVGNVGTCMVVFPRVAKPPRWMDSNAQGTVSDFGWMSAALGMKRIEWHDELLAEVRP